MRCPTVNHQILRQLLSRVSLACKLSLVIGSLCLLSCNGNSNLSLSPGEEPPSISLPSADASTETLARYRGKIVLLNFWSSWCGPCITELPQLKELAKSLGDKFVIFAVAVDDNPQDAIRAAGELPANFRVVLDRNREAFTKYKVSGFPESFVLDSEGKFILFPDPEARSASVRIVGPREWSSAAMKSRFGALLKRVE